MRFLVLLKHNEDKCFRVVLIAFGKIPGDWEHYRDESKMLAAIEPVTEGIMQLFCQTVILGTVHTNNLYPQHSTMKLAHGNIT